MATPMPFPESPPRDSPRPDDPADQEALDRAINDWWDHTLTIEKATEARDAAAAVILALLPPGTVRGSVSVARGRRRFSPELAARALSAAQFASICEYAPSVRLAREKLDGEFLDSLYIDSGTPFVRRAT